MYDNTDEEEPLAGDFHKQKKMYAKEGIYNAKGNAIQRLPPLPPKQPSTTKEDNTNMDAWEYSFHE